MAALLFCYGKNLGHNRYFKSIFLFETIIPQGKSEYHSLLQGNPERHKVGESFIWRGYA